MNNKMFSVVNDKSISILDNILKEKDFNTYTMTTEKNGWLYRFRYQCGRKNFMPSIKVFIKHDLVCKYSAHVEELFRKHAKENLWA